MARFLLLPAFLAGCVIEDPQNIEIRKPYWSDDARKAAIKEWSDRLEDPWITVTFPPKIRWFEGKCLIYIDYLPDQEEIDCLGGRYWGHYEQIHLAIDNTAMAHELLHWSLDESCGDLDPDHEDPMWDEVGEVQKIIDSAID